MGSVYAYFHHLANIILKQTIFVVNGHDFIGLNVFIINNRLSLSLSLSLSEQLKLFPLRQHLAYNKCMFMFKLRNRKVPEYMQEFFKESHSKYAQASKLYVIPRPRVDIFKASLSFSGAMISGIPFRRALSNL